MSTNHHGNENRYSGHRLARARQLAFSSSRLSLFYTREQLTERQECERNARLTNNTEPTSRTTQHTWYTPVRLSPSLGLYRFARYSRLRLNKRHMCIGNTGHVIAPSCKIGLIVKVIIFPACRNKEIDRNVGT